MYPEGHTGLSLLVLSLLMLTFGWLDFGSIAACLIIVTLSSLPDIDLHLRPLVKHRGATHTLLFGIIFGAIFGFIFHYGGYNWFLGFVGGFGGTLLHILGDVFTYEPMTPLWPFSNRDISFGFFAAKNQVINKGLATLGGFAFVVVVLKYSGFFGAM